MSSVRWRVFGYEDVRKRAAICRWLSVSILVVASHREHFIGSRRLFLFATAFALWLAAAQPGHAASLRVANRGDVLSMDPHSLFEALQTSFLANLYEPLVKRGKDMQLVPALAVRWRQASPTVWRFELRRGVRFHDGTPFDADDVVFSFGRAAGDGSDMKNVTAPIKSVRRIDAFTVDIETLSPMLILPDTLTTLGIMSRAWCESVQAGKPVDRRKGIENTASFKANGTGPYRLKERQPGSRTMLVRHAAWWGQREGNVDEVVFTPIASDATRAAALLSGEIDLMEPVPLQDVERLRAGGFGVLEGPELRTIFLGMDQARDELLYSDVKGRNPFKDKRVRKAFYEAIDIETIHERVMHKASTPAGLMIGPGIRGFQADMNKRLPYDPAAAKALLAEAGYPNGFEVGLHCPNDRYVSDAAICQAVAAALAHIGVKVALRSESKAIWFPRLLRRDTSFHLFGWTPPTNDALNAIVNLMATPAANGRGQYNVGGFSNPRIDELAAAIQVETDEHRRQQMIRQAFAIHQEEIGHIPLHQQALAWGFDKRIAPVQLPDDSMVFDWIVVKPD